MVKINFKTVFRIAWIFSTSSIRTSTKSLINPNSILRKPTIFLVVDVITFVGVFLLTTIFLNKILTTLNVKVLAFQIFAGFPALLTMFMVIYGVLWEFNPSTRGISKDTINWLPVKPSEYVLGSAFSLLYVTSWVLVACLSLTLVFALYLGWINVWLIFLGLCLTSIFIGAFFAEILKDFIGKISLSFYKRGRIAIPVRIFTTIILLVAIMIGFNVNIMYKFLQTFVSQISLAWFIPLFWSSITLTSFFEGNFVQATIFGILSLTFCLGVFWVSAKLKFKFWSLTPATITFTQTIYKPKIGFLNRLGFNQPAAALIRKDLKALIRRREMVVLIALPVAFTTLTLINTFLGSQKMKFEVVYFNLLLAPFIFALLISLASIGQEGKSVWNIYVAPISIQELIKAKLGFTLLLTIPILIGEHLILIPLLNINFQTFLILLPVSMLALTETVLIGLGFGAKYPDFRTIPKTRLVSQTGALLGFLTCGIAVSATFLPLIIYKLKILNLTLPLTFTLSLTIAAIILILAYKLLKISYKNLYNKKPS